MYSFRVSTLRGLYHSESINFYRYFHCYCKCFFHFLHLLIIPITHFNQLLLICWQFFQNAKHFMISLPEKRNKLLLYYRRFFFLFFVTVIWKVRYFSIVKIIKFEIQTAFRTVNWTFFNHTFIKNNCFTAIRTAYFIKLVAVEIKIIVICLLYTSPSPRDTR